MENQLLANVEYQVEKTRWGSWRRHFSGKGQYFAEFRSNATFLGMPVLHYTHGKCPETGRRIVAKGIIAVGTSGGGDCGHRPCLAGVGGLRPTGDRHTFRTWPGSDRHGGFGTTSGGSLFRGRSIGYRFYRHRATGSWTICSCPGWFRRTRMESRTG